MKLRIFTLFLFGFAFAFEAAAYIPNSKFILVRLAKNSGRGSFQVEQEVQFRTETEPLVLRERWIVEAGDSLHVTVTGSKGSLEGYRFEALYKDGKKYAPDTSGVVRTSAQSNEFFEPYLYFKSSKGIMDALIRHRILPPNMNAHKKPMKSFNNVVYSLEPFVRLARSGGVITYAFGQPTPVNAARPNPGFWVDQDSFLFRRIRFSTRAEVEAENHFYATGGLRIPRERNVSWETSAATIRVLTVKSIPPATAKKSLTAASLGSGKANAAKLPDSAAVQEFYQRFR